MKSSDEVGWQWGNGGTTGEVVEIHDERTQIESDEATIIRSGRIDDPAIVIMSDNGSKVVKLAHEVQVIKGGSDV